MFREDPMITSILKDSNSAPAHTEFIWTTKLPEQSGSFSIGYGHLGRGDPTVSSVGFYRYLFFNASATALTTAISSLGKPVTSITQFFDTSNK